jgi:hypothetical protein
MLVSSGICTWMSSYKEECKSLQFQSACTDTRGVTYKAQLLPEHPVFPEPHFLW